MQQPNVEANIFNVLSLDQRNTSTREADVIEANEQGRREQTVLVLSSALVT